MADATKSTRKISHFFSPDKAIPRALVPTASPAGPTGAPVAETEAAPTEASVAETEAAPTEASVAVTEAPSPSTAAPAPESTKTYDDKCRSLLSGFKFKFPWLTVDDVTGRMRCSICMKSPTCTSGIAKQVWVDEGSTRWQKATCTKHENSTAHLDSVAFAQKQADPSTSIAGRLESAVKAHSEKKAADILQAGQGHLQVPPCPPHVLSMAVSIYTPPLATLVSCTKMAYALATSSVSARQFPGLLAASHRAALALGATITPEATQQTRYAMREILGVFADILAEDFLLELEQSDFIGVGIDESTDVSSAENMVVYIYYIKDGEPACKYFKILKLKGATATEITEALVKCLADAGLLSKVVCFGSDGASVMTGKDNGVAAMLRADERVFKCLLAFHCICHNLALGANEAAEQVPYCAVVDSFVKSIYNLFAHSAKRQDELLALQQKNDEIGKIKRSCSTRWLSRSQVKSTAQSCHMSNARPFRSYGMWGGVDPRMLLKTGPSFCFRRFVIVRSNAKISHKMAPLPSPPSI